MINPTTEFIYGTNYSTGTTVYQGDNRLSLKNIQFWQNKIEIRKKNKFFIRVYRTSEDAGDSYDAVFTAIKLQEYNQTSNQDWYSAYKNNWKDSFNWENVSWEAPQYSFIDQQWTFQGNPIEILDWISMSDSVLIANTNLIISTHENIRDKTDLETNQLIPGTVKFNNMLENITSKIPSNGGTGFYDKSALNHLHGEYFLLNNDYERIKIGGNIRQYTPDTKGSLFMDTTEMIVNTEVGIYMGFEKNIDNGTLSTTLRYDKNENFNLNFSPAISIVLTPTEKDVIRFSVSSAIRNPTLSDQYLYYNVGRAILIGNLNGHGTDYGENLVTVQSLINYYLPVTPSKDSLNFFSVKPIQPEKARSAEIGYRTTLFNKLYVDANYYYSRYTDFIGYKIGVKYDTIGNNNIDAYEISLKSIQAYRIAANAENTVTTQGASVGVNYYLYHKYSLNGNYSWNRLNEEGTEDPIIPAYNTPEHKYNLGFSGKEIHFSNSKYFLRNFSFSVNYKWVEGFTYEGSPQFTGNVPTYDLVDVQLSKKLTELNATLKVGSSNVLNNKHYEVYGGPYIGRMTYCSLLFELD